MMTLPRLLFVLALAAFLGACSPYFVNGKLDRFDKDAGYRYGKLSGEDNSDNIFVILAFSGGGTRAAAFSFGVMEGLRDAVYKESGGTRRFLDDVDVISVSYTSPSPRDPKTSRMPSSA
jgi:NTE family protein